MSNMSYCRFENTLRALEDCFNNWDDSIDDQSSDYEIKAHKQLLALCKTIADECESEHEHLLENAN